MTTKISTLDLLATVEDLGHRMTGPRRHVIYLLSQKHEGFTGEELNTELPTVGRATIFRTLKMLLEAGVVCKLSLPSGETRYALSRFGHHHHTVCTNCGTVAEFRDSAVERLLRSVKNEVGGDLVGHRLEFYIVCSSCKDTARG
jgi:Fe2+ or Zn2+ uptake regulation protein